jgi:peptidoglycan/xylan/chitin deacetylase (PgdA/CDA1 family)
VNPRRLIAVAALAASVLAATLVLLPAIQSRPAARGRSTARRAPAPARRAAGAAPAPRRPRILAHHRSPVPILAYHVIATPQPGAPYGGLYVPPPLLRAQLAALAQARYHAVTLRQVFDYWRKGYALPSRPVVLSFDDGYLSDYTRAAPMLKQHHWPGVLNLMLGDLRNHGGLSARMVRAMIADGWEVDSHTLTHPDLTTVDAARLRHELVGSKAELTRRFGVRADFFCYPAGRFDARVAAAVRAAGYTGATTERPGLASPAQPFELQRVRVGPTTSPQTLTAELAALRG